MSVPVSGAAQDGNLGDDQVKLVHYSVVWLKRDQERILTDGELVVTDNLSDDAFANWIISRYVQQPLPGGDRKHLRVCYQVRRRWARQERGFETGQLDALRGILDAVRRIAHAGNGPRPTPYLELMSRLERSRDTFDRWRYALGRCAGPLSVDLVEALAAHRTSGEPHAPRVEAAELAEALRQPLRFNRSSLETMSGRAVGDLRSELPRPPGRPPRAVRAPLHSIWGPVVEKDGIITQMVTGSRVAYVAPDAPDLHRYLERGEVDLLLTAFAPHLGLVRWSSLEHSCGVQMRSIGYELSGRRLLWVSQLVSNEPASNDEGRYVLALEFELDADGKRTFNVYALHIDLDFDKCEAKLADRS